MLRSIIACKSCRNARNLNFKSSPFYHANKSFANSKPRSLEEVGDTATKNPSSAYNGLKTVYITRDAIRSQNIWVWFGVAALGCVAIVAFMPELKIGVSKHTADLATRSLQDETLQMHTRELASQIVQTVLEDPKVLQQASQFIHKLSTMTSTREAVRNLVIQTLEDRVAMQKVHEAAGVLISALLKNPELRAQLIELVQDTLHHHQTNEAVMQLVNRVLQDASIRSNVTDLAAQLLLEKNVEQSLTTAITSSVHNTLSDDEIQSHAKDFVSNVVRDHTVQAQGSQALWRTVQYAVTPTWLNWLWPASAMSIHDIPEKHQVENGMGKDQDDRYLKKNPIKTDQCAEANDIQQLFEDRASVKEEPLAEKATPSTEPGSRTFEESLADQDWNQQGFL